MESRRLAAVLLVAAATQTALTLAGLPGWPCPVHAVTGLPCPGCGLSRASAAVLRGDLRSAAQTHPFIFPALAVIPLLLAAALGPSSLVRRLSLNLRALEARTRISFILVAAFLVHGLVRLVAGAVPFLERAFGSTS